MASNLNKAFMRAYAKDRPAAAAAEPAIPSTPVAPVNAAMQSAPTHSVSPTLAPTVQSRVPLVQAVHSAVAAPSAAPIAQPTYQQQPAPSQRATVLKPHSTITGSLPVGQVQPQPTYTAAPRAQVQQTVQPSVKPSAQPSVTERMTRPAPPAANQTVATRPAAKPIVTASHTPVAQAPTTQATSPQRAVAPAASAQPNADAASQVWRRIDAAHQAQAHQPTTLPNRPTASVAAGNVAPPRRMQAAAAAPAPVAPAPAPIVRTDHGPATNDRLPLLGDETSSNPENQSGDARRRTVADFLYSAGQYNPGRILASADTAQDHSHSAPAMGTQPMGTQPMATQTMSPAPVSPMPMRASDAARTHEESHYMAAMPGQASMPGHMLDYETETMSPTVEEPMQRRMGQILRVDVPRNTTTTTNNAAMAYAAPPVTAPAAAPMRPAPMPTAPAAAAPSAAVQMEAPVAKYVIEQRRLDRSHKINAAEDKLRSNKHKIFNPVWEVDNLQWPSVVDKLMQQRADSMAHVAAHMKSACDDGLSILGVTSAEAAEGRTTVACCLARLAAAHGLNVCLVDLDLDRPTVCIQTNMEVEHDWRDCLTEDISLEEVAVHSIDDQLTVLPLKPRGDRPGLLASDGRIAEVLKELAESFELVIVDCSRTASSGNVITGLAHTKVFDAAIVVVDRRDTHQDRVEDAVRMIQQTGIESIGIVDNFSM